MSAELVGREEELQRVELFLEAARHAPRVLVIEGEAGAGKTSVWEAGLLAAAGAGSHTVAARPAEAESSFAYAALGDLLRERADGMDGLPSRLRNALKVALRLDDEATDAPDQQSVALGLLALFARFADDGPLVVAVDDVQWLDAASAQVLRFAMRRIHEEPIAFLVAWRTARDAPLPLELDRAPASERLERLPLPPLSLGAVQHLIQDHLGFVPPRPALRRLHDLSGGNPFFALELARALRGGTLQLEPGERLPVALNELVGARLEALSPASRHALATAAALAQPTLALVDAVSGGGGEALDEAERADIIAVRDGRIRFTHPLLASGAYAAIEPSLRRELHTRAGTRVTDPEERARHLALAATGPDEAVAGALEDAARRAESRGAPPAAAELYQLAVRLTPPAARRDVLLRTMEAGFCTFQSGDGRRARVLLDGVVAELEPGPDRARALISLARVRSYDDDLRAAEALFRQALDEAGGDDELRAAAGENLASILFRLRERLPEAVEHASTAALAARSSGSTGWLAEALGVQVMAEAALGRRAQAARTLESALELQAECEDRRTMAQPLFQAAVVWLWWDDLERARDGFEWLLRRGRDMGDEGSLPYVLVLAAQVECVRGDLVLAAAHADEGYALTEQTGQDTLGGYLLALRSLAHAAAGEERSARDLADRALAIADRTSGRPAEHFALAALGLLELSLGRAAEAGNALGPLVAFLRREQIREPGTARVVPDHVEALIGLGELDAAAELLDWYAHNAQQLARPSALAAAARCRGLIHAERGDLDGALTELGRAVELSGQVPIPLEYGRALLAHGAVHRRARHKRAARESLEAAGAAFRGMGARIWEERARTELGRVGGRAAASGELTPTERRVAELAAEGLQTKQVAAALFVSTKTVEGHLTNIYAKLGVHSRTELARRLAQPEGDSSLRSEHA
jgi:DNA-binding CsgD family transcriptional regulator/tetratricopeptide (TPR) repeat protein